MTKTVCDRCGRDITGRVAVLRFDQGTSWDLCESCEQDVKRLLHEPPPQSAEEA